MTETERQRLCDEVTQTNRERTEREQAELTRKTYEAVCLAVPVVTVDLRHVPCLDATRRFTATNSTTEFSRVLRDLRRLEQDGVCRVVELSPDIPPQAYADEVEAEMKRGEELRARKQTSKNTNI